MPETFDWIIYGLRDDLRVLRRAKCSDYSEDRQHESEVADAIRDEGFAGSIRGFLFVEVVTNQQIRTEADAFPADKHHHEIRAHHQHQHRKHEQAHVRKEAIEAGFAVHITGREHEDAKTDAGDD